MGPFVITFNNDPHSGSQGLLSRPRKMGTMGTAATHRHHLALGGHEGGPVADPKLGLQRVEVDLQLALLLHLGGLMLTTVIPEVL